MVNVKLIPTLGFLGCGGPCESRAPCILPLHRGGTTPIYPVMSESAVKAVLGPTNTGKTHLAVERLCAHSSGMIGFPLRLLAREVYDRVCAIKGHAHVALLTGEERISPPGARWIVGTTESMPVGRDLAFVAIDEAQLGADRERGHVFTDRILNVRGREETLILGSETLRPVLRKLEPRAEFITRPRFSRLSYAGSKKLSRLPKRSAIVAFSAQDVYAIAELIRRTHGGAAVVMGALSPRTRNAQVAMFQSGEVDYLVATDAIGMGLNMDVGHIAFASLSKFDGLRQRRLTVTEMAQIAGRAGRHQRDGTFGTVTGSDPANAFQPEEIERIEDHAFRPLDHLCWRESTLDFASTDALIDALDHLPPSAALRLAPEALDIAVLKRLCADPETVGRVSNATSVARLWEVCGLPDFRQTGADFHARLVARLFSWLHAPEGRIPGGVLANELTRLESPQGDISALTGRIAGIRTWAYACQRPDWVEDADRWAERARVIEDRLSDALHARLTQRFVDRRTTLLARSVGRAPETFDVDISEQGAVAVEEVTVGSLLGFRFQVDPQARLGERKQLLAAADRFLARELARRATSVCEAPDGAFALRTDFDQPIAIVWREVVIATLAKAGRSGGLRPALHTSSDTPAIPMESAIEERLDRWLLAFRAKRLAALDQMTAIAKDFGTEPALRSVLSMLVAQGGHIERSAVNDALEALSAAGRKSLRQTGVVTGTLDLHHPALLKPEAVRVRLALDAALRGERMPAIPMPGLTLLDAPSEALARGARSAGFRNFDGQMVRIDIVERIARAIHDQRRGDAAFVVDPQCATSLGIGEPTLARIMRAIGFRRAPGTSAPPLWRWRGIARRGPVRSRPDNPSFAVLGALRGSQPR
jgi:ATP-dependent RNA helicase SUPV3L1/SUV3